MTGLSEIIDTTEWPQKLLVTVGVVIGAFLLWFIIDWLVRRWISRKADRVDEHDLAGQATVQRLRTLGAMLEKVLHVLLVAGAVVYIMIIWGIPVGPLLALGGAIGLAVGFGAQDLVKDVIAGFFVLVEDQYAIGDVVELAGADGTVEEIRLRTTVLRGLDGSLHHVPNGEVRVATNLTPDYSRVVIDVGISYDADVDAAIAALSDEAARFRSDPDWTRAHADDPQVLGVDELGDSSVVIRVMFTTDPEKRWAVKREFLRRVKYRLDAEGIEIAYPHLQIVQGTIIPQVERPAEPPEPR
jgi:moderate conductance mechanosensitive channel